MQDYHSNDLEGAAIAASYEDDFDTNTVDLPVYPYRGNLSSSEYGVYCSYIEDGYTTLDLYNGLMDYNGWCEVEGLSDKTRDALIEFCKEILNG